MLDATSLKNIKKLPPEQQAEILELLRELEETKRRESAAMGFMPFVNYIWPQFIEGRHHQIMAKAFDRIVDGSLKRLIINMPPRHTKSEFASFLLPAMFLGRYPDRKVLQLSHNADLATGFGRRVRDLIDTEKYRHVFPETLLKADQKAAGRWNTSNGGSYVAMGIGGRLAGIGADALIIDDPHSEQEYIQALSGDASAFDKAYEWYQTGPRQRLQPGGAIVIVMTRWHKRDLTGRVIHRMTSADNADQWEIIEFPAFLPTDTTQPLWPEFWSEKELIATRQELSSTQWNAQYMQNPTSEEGALVKREWWRIWEKKRPPVCEYVIQSWDTAFTAKETSDYSACTTWGVFYRTDDDGYEQPQIILLDAFKGRLEFPDLKRKALEMWKERQPDAFVVEAKASGLPLIHELRQMGIPVQEFTPTRGNDKVIRVNAVSDLFASGHVWCPETRWAEEVMEEFAAFPLGEHDDLVDSSTQALLRFRQGGFIRLDSDDRDDGPMYRQKREYY